MADDNAFHIDYRVLAFNSANAKLHRRPVGVVARYLAHSRNQFVAPYSADAEIFLEALSGAVGLGWIYAEWVARLEEANAPLATSRDVWNDISTLCGHGGMMITEGGSIPATAPLSDMTNSIYCRHVSSDADVQRAYFQVNWRSKLAAAEFQGDRRESVELTFDSKARISVDFLYEGARPVMGWVLAPQKSDNAVINDIARGAAVAKRLGFARDSTLVLFDSEQTAVSQVARRKLESHAKLLDVNLTATSDYLSRISRWQRFGTASDER